MKTNDVKSLVDVEFFEKEKERLGGTPRPTGNTDKQPRRLFVLSGGGLPGLRIHAAYLRALEYNGIRPQAGDCIAGTSAGAAIGAMWADGRYSAEEIERIVLGLRDKDVRKERLFWKARVLWVDWFLHNEPIMELLEKWVAPRFSALRCGFRCTAINKTNGAAMVCDWGELRPAVMASMSINGVFPPMNIGGTFYVDAGPKRNVPLLPGWDEFDEVYILIAAQPIDYSDKPNGLIFNLLRNAEWSAEAHIERTLREVAGLDWVCVIRSDAGKGQSSLRFGPEEISSNAYWDARAQLWQRKEDLKKGEKEEGEETTKYTEDTKREEGEEVTTKGAKDAKGGEGEKSFEQKVTKGKKKGGTGK